MSDLNINWDEVIKKEALGIGDYDLGEILGVEAGHVITKKGTVDKDKFSLPKDLVERYDGHKVWFKISQEDAQRYQRYQLTALRTYTLPDLLEIIEMIVCHFILTV